MVHFVFLTVFLSIGQPMPKKDEVKLSIPGPRSISGIVKHNDGHFFLTISMKPFLAFDDSRNDLYNASKLKAYSIAMVEKILEADKFEIINYNFKWIKKNKDICQAQISFECSKISKKITKGVAINGKKLLVLSSFKAGKDLLETISMIKSDILKDIEALKEEMDFNEFQKVSITIKKRISNFSTLIQNEVNDNLLIFDSNINEGDSKPEIINSVKEIEKQLLDAVVEIYLNFKFHMFFERSWINFILYVPRRFFDFPIHPLERIFALSSLDVPVLVPVSLK